MRGHTRKHLGVRQSNLRPLGMAIRKGNLALMHCAPGCEPVQVYIGDRLLDFRGEPATVTDGVAPSGVSTGRVCTDVGTYYPSVFNCEWREI